MIEATQFPCEHRDDICLKTEEGNFRFQSISENIIRCEYTTAEDFVAISPIGVESVAIPLLSAREDIDKYIVSAGSLKVEINKKDSRFTWIGPRGEKLLQEGDKELTETPVVFYTLDGEEPVIRRVKTVDGERNFIENLHPIQERLAFKAKLNFEFEEDESIHGFGQAEEGIFNYRGHTQYLYQHNMRTPIPFFISSKGYGILVDCGCLMTFNDDERGSYLHLENVEQLDYYFITGEKMDDIITGFRMLTGKAALLPKWSYGYIQSKERYENQDELVFTATRYRDLNVGLDCVVQDWKTWKDDEWGCKRVDRERFPDLNAMSEKLNELNVHSMVSIWPNINSGTVDHDEMKEKGYLLQDMSTYDAFNEEARRLYWEQCEHDLFSGGFDAWWCDSTEPFSGPDWSGKYMREPWERFELVGREHEKFLGQQRANLYSLYHARGIFENQRTSNPDKRVLNLTRSGYAGIQKYGTMLWSGDVSASWDTLRKQVVEGLNMAFSGMPWWTLDIGGFFVVNKNWEKRGCGCNNDPSPKWFWHGEYEEGVDDLAYRELYVRWLELGVFLPMFRSHGTDAAREIWNFGVPGEVFYDSIAKNIALRYSLMPYIYSIAGNVFLRDGLMIRPLIFDFPRDDRAKNVDNEYMFGPSLLVCPVTHPMFFGKNSTMMGTANTTVSCYLPAGCAWYDLYTQERFYGGCEVTVNSSLDRIPVFVRAGSIIPREKELSYASEEVKTPLEFHIYPGANGSFDYYEDGGDDYAYEDGICNDILLSWDDDRSELTVGASSYIFPGSLKGRKCVAIMGNRRKEFTYMGREITVSV
ncbi:MAG: DUF5110 domain-containing protein [Lachnospiraceae bacterium]|nr:DUF5110 domain-containing protein [Lachnospiraceae bacterium]